MTATQESTPQQLLSGPMEHEVHYMVGRANTAVYEYCIERVVSVILDSL